MNNKPLDLALVTGATAGIGRAFAYELAARGVNLVLVARRRDMLESLAAELTRDFSITASVEVVDLAIPGAALLLAGRCAGRVDLLVNNAGAAVATDQQLASPAQVSATLQLNVVATVELSLAFGAAMKQRGHGYILNVGSMTAYVGAPALRTYGPSKRFIQAFSDELREELSPSGVTVTTLVPGLTRTDWFEHAGVPFDPVAATKLGMMEAPDVARIGIDAVLAGRRTRVAGPKNRLIAIAASLLPRAMTRALVGKARAQLHPALPTHGQ